MSSLRYDMTKQKARVTKFLPHFAKSLSGASILIIFLMKVRRTKKAVYPGRTHGFYGVEAIAWTSPKLCS
jgi:hypothetical protein